jgi:transcriptional regulator with XRE-family HTH domain
MVLLRRVIGDALRARRQGQHRTLREVSTAANVSLGYLSEIERGQKEASSELLAAICEALGARLSEVLGEVSDTLALAEGMQGVLATVPGEVSEPAVEPTIRKVDDGDVQVSVRQNSPLKATLRTRRKRGRDMIYAA